MRRKQNCEEIVLSYLKAKSLLIQMGYAEEIDWQEQRRLENLTERDFLRESAWVILSSGMRESVIRSKFNNISKIFFDWKSSVSIVERKDECLARSLQVFNHRGKFNAILKVCENVYKHGFLKIKSTLSEQGVDYIRTMPYMGPVTSYHLAKNLGMDVVKPDRHLSRISEIAGYHDPVDMCTEISHRVGDKLSVIDIVLWRFATLFSYNSLFAGTLIMGKKVEKDKGTQHLIDKYVNYV